MLLEIILGFSLLMSSSTPSDNVKNGIPSGFEMDFSGNYAVDYNLNFSSYKRGNFELNIVGAGLGYDLMLGGQISIYPEIGVGFSRKARNDYTELSLLPYASLRMLYLFPTARPNFQIGFKIKEIFDEEVGVDFFNIGIGFRL